MSKYLQDTNIVLRFSNPSDAQHELATAAGFMALQQCIRKKSLTLPRGLLNKYRINTA